MRNALLNGGWGSEESEGKFPLSHDLAFDVTIVNEPYAFQVKIIQIIAKYRWNSFQRRRASK